jgi:Rieske Fe-S protein
VILGRRMTRRQMFVAGTAAGSAAIGLMLSIPAIGFLLSPLTERKRTLAAQPIRITGVPVGVPTPFVAAVPLGEGPDATQTVDRVVYVVRPNETDYVFLSNTCTHMQCNVHWDTSLNQFLCPCHGGLYDMVGANVGGPPPSPLPRWQHTVQKQPDGSLALTVYNAYDEKI